MNPLIRDESIQVASDHQSRKTDNASLSYKSKNKFGLLVTMKRRYEKWINSTFTGRRLVMTKIFILIFLIGLPLIILVDQILVDFQIPVALILSLGLILLVTELITSSISETQYFHGRTSIMWLISRRSKFVTLVLLAIIGSILVYWLLFFINITGIIIAACLFVLILTLVFHYLSNC